MRIQDVMTDEIVTISAEANVAEAREKLRLNRIRHLVVIENRRVVGVLSDRDLAHRSDDLRIGEVMTKHVATISPRATLRQAAARLEGRTIDCLPVMNRGELAGIVTTSDLMRALANGAHPAPSAERYILRKRGPRKRPVS
ncbi:MAG TPA: CBS domain-containing protein [Thermoanaerobaculia bacterium]|nr:CBS domain-containing protein [Thermoanaerobaculia bacterium]